MKLRKVSYRIKIVKVAHLSFGSCDRVFIEIFSSLADSERGEVGAEHSRKSNIVLRESTVEFPC